MHPILRLALLALVLGMAMAGCSASTDSGTPLKPPTADEYEAMMKRIESDPDLSEPAKQQALAGLRTAQSRAEAAAAIGASADGQR
jgi:hypothetical protein